MIETIGDPFGELAAVRHPGKIVLEPGLQGLDDGFRSLLAYRAPDFGRRATDLCLDVVELPDAGERLGRDRRVAADIDLVELSPQVAPTVGKRHRPTRPCRRGQLLVGGVAVDLQDAVEAVEQLGGVLAAAARRIGVGHSRRTTSPVLRRHSRIRTSAPGPVVTRDRPQVSGLGLASARIEHRTARLVAEQPR